MLVQEEDDHMAVQQCLNNIRALIHKSLSAEIELQSRFLEPEQDSPSALLTHLLEDLTVPSNNQDFEDSPRGVCNALETLVTDLAVPALVSGGSSGLILVLAWSELWESQFYSEYSTFRNPMLEEGMLSDTQSLVNGLINPLPINGAIDVDTPDGKARFSYQRGPTGWEFTGKFPNGVLVDFAHLLCILTFQVPAGKYAIPISMYEMLEEPRPFQLHPFDYQGNQELGNGHTWWPEQSK